MNIFFDLDGTLLDSKQRLYRLFCDLTKQTILCFDEYWELKKSMNDHRYILSEYFNYSSSEIIEFEEKWMSLIETKEYLLYDTPFVFTSDVLRNLQNQGCDLYLITARQNKQYTIQQLEQFGIESYFVKMLVTEFKKPKFELIIESGIKLVETDLYVGDTGQDIEIAKLMGIRSMGVLSGFRNRTSLLRYKPDYIENDIQGVLKYV